jgi:predicted alpha/beta-hydrolase family hydrolase
VSHAADERLVPTPYGEGRLVTHRARSPIATLLLSHGAGRGIDAPDLVALAAALPRAGVSVLLWEQPWVRAGRKVASPPATLDVGLRAAAATLRLRTPLVVGGRSAGARSALRCARDLGAAGCLALSFPLHPPGKPERSRLEEVTAAGVPTLVVQGERDPMGRPEEFPDPLPPDVVMAVVPAADHGLAVPRSAPLSADDATALVVESALEWLQWIAREGGAGATAATRRAATDGNAART